MEGNCVLKNRVPLDREAAKAFALQHCRSYDLSYVPDDVKLDICHSAMGSVRTDIECSDGPWFEVDIRNSLDDEVGRRLLQYMEYEPKSK